MRKLANRILVLGILLAMLPFFSHAEEISPRKLLEVVDFSPPVVSPDGSSVAFRVEQASIERDTYDSYWYVQRVEGDASPRLVADGGAPLRDTAGVVIPTTAVWSPDGRWIYYRARLDGRIDVWRAATDGSSAEPITRDPADVRDFSLSDDGRTLMYSVGASRERILRAEQAEYDRGIRIDNTVPIGQGLFRSGYINGRLETQRYTGLWFDRAGLLATEPDHWKALDLETRAVRDLAPSDRPTPPLAPFDLARGIPEPWKLSLDPSTGRIALLTRVGNGEGLVRKRKPDVQLAMLPNRTANKPILCVAELCTNKAISGMQWRPGSDEVLFTVTDPAEGLAQSIYSWNVQTGAARLVIRVKGLLSGGRDSSSPCGLSSLVLVCVTAAAAQPPRLERIDLESGKRHVLFDPNADLAADMRRTVQPQLLRWSDGAGHHFTGQFFQARRAGHGPSPLFVNYYDCRGFLRGGVGDEWPFASLAEDGVSALCINHGPWFADAVARYDEGLSAVKSAVDLLASQGKIDRTHVGMGGLSFGSEIALWVATKSDLLTAVSVTSPPISPLYYLLNSLKGRSLAVGLKNVWQLGSPEKTPKRWRILSPAYSVDKFHAPLLLQMSEQEYIYSLDYVMPLLLDKRADMYVFPNEPHQKFQPKHKLVAYERNLDWFRFWLQGYEDPSSDKRVQYEHWRVMRDRMNRQRR
ncbi:MAG TPA: Atxe2 family lasso peptide isopeptidase [Candidatus Acidoferrales bacterium]|nr:Atxe2 family lasso peptide isopeptidase [Candidatus Acidoferrales bacterium]